MKYPLYFIALVSTASAWADYNLARNGKTVSCSGEDNMSWVLNAERTTIKYEVEGESNGPQRIKKVKSDNDTFVSYTTEEGTLTLSDRGDSWSFNGDSESGRISCK